ncbi:MAG: RNA 2',3'-cyclic phosphodiesterase [Spirochaetia bacterium]|nr:RNA 2',3'-cyclic phosphodiesterase [Spirochaetia bacterium]
MRLFIAVPVPEKNRKNLMKKIQHIDDPRYIKTSNGEGLHITVAFLGECSGTDLIKIKTVMNTVCSQFQDFIVTYSGISSFPKEGYPRVIISPIIEGKDMLRSMHKQIGTLLNVGERKKFSPHITLGRIKKSVSIPVSYKNTIDELKLLSKKDLQESFQADRIVLFLSELTSRGAVYTRLQENILWKKNE